MPSTLMDRIAAERKLFGGILTTRGAIAVYMQRAGFDRRAVDYFAWGGESVEAPEHYTATPEDLAAIDAGEWPEQVVLRP